VGEGLVTVAVKADVLVRSRGLIAVRGQVRLVPEMKRFRGRATEKPFGEDRDRMLRASGDGAILFRAGEARHVAIDLTGDSGYFREEAIFGFEDAVSFENGRVASRVGPDLNLVHLRGSGQLLLACQGAVATLEVTREAPVQVPVRALVGWTGALTPRLAPLTETVAGADHEPGAPIVVELTGEGRVLVDEGAAL
jgi:uncharacterized protein (AIM24 family)